MQAELATSPVTPSRAGPRPERLTRRASLNAAAGLVDYIARIGVQFVITPILLSALGRSLFGIWEMLTRMVTYVAATDGRPNEALRLVVAQQQSVADAERRRRQVGAALAVWLLLLPLAAVIGTVIVWLAPALTHTAGDQAAAVRVTGLLLFAAVVLTSLGAIPESVLRGSNLGYRRIGVQAAVHIVGGVLAVVAVLAGMSLRGLAAVQVVIALLTGFCFWLIVRRFVSWFGAARPTRADVRGMLGISLWIAAGDIIAKVLLASDVIVLGAIAGPALVTSYVLTGYAARVATGIHIFAAGASMPGFGDVMGRGERVRAARARHELLLLTWLFATVTGAMILLWNRTFLEQWVGAGNYAGSLVDLLIVLIFAQTLFIRTDAWLLDAALEPAQRVKVSAPAAVLTLIATLLLTRALGIAGLCLGILAGRLLQSVRYPKLVALQLHDTEREGAPARLEWPRMVAASALLLAAAMAGGQSLGPLPWPALVAGVVVSAPLVAVAALLTGTGRESRRRLLRRLRAVRTGGR